MQANPGLRALALAAGGLALIASGGCGEDSARAGRAGRTPGSPPALDIVLIVIDTLRADALLDPAGKYQTPNLDRLASEGIVFERAFSAAPMTLPAHMSLFSSRPVLETGVFTNNQGVPTELPLLAEWLSEHGYETRAVLSLGTLDPMFGPLSPARGFASYDHDYRNLAPAEETSRRLRASLAARDPEKPLFLFAHFSDPHEPYDSHGTRSRLVQVTMNGAPLVQLQAADMQQWSQTVELPGGSSVFELAPFAWAQRTKPRFMVRYFECLEEDGSHAGVRWEEGARMERTHHSRVVVERGERAPARCELRIWVNDVPASDEAMRARYALDVAHADRYVGELVAELERLGLYRDSLILFTSDHGEGLGEHGCFGHVMNVMDSLIQVPLIVRLPEGDARGPELERAARGVVSHIDLVPTLLDVAGLPPLPGQRGTSLLVPHARVHVAQTSRPEAEKDQLALRDERFKMVYFPEEERFALYDVAADR